MIFDIPARTLIRLLRQLQSVRGQNWGRSVSDPVAEFMHAMTAAGMRPLEQIAAKLATGQPVRFRCEGDKPGRRNGWARLHLDGIPAGVFRHYRLDIRTVWRAGSNARELSPAERRALRAQVRENEAKRLAETQDRQKAAAIEARNLWRSAERADRGHGYLLRKGLPPFGIRQQGDALLVPMVDAAFRLWNVQRVYPDGRKLFLAGGRTNGLFWPHAAMFDNGQPTAGPLVIGEGFATLAAIYQATRHGVVAALSAPNLEPVALAMRKLFPQRVLIIAADDDCHLSENKGMIAAHKAAKAVGALLATPQDPAITRPSSEAGTDFADMTQVQVAARIAQAGSAIHG